uniref:CHK kinase-like domain-containing protein n=1 Tax=Bactrocera latifrons TaxID=174628 RepID=A0A0K8W2C4_BACLA
MTNNENCCEDEFTFPKWLNEAFFQNVLQNVESEVAEITNLELKPGTLKNDNYASVLFRSKVTYRLQSQPTQEKVSSFILKVEPFMEGNKKELMQNYSLFDTEITMYTKVLPIIEKVLRQYGDNTILGPKLIACSTTAPSYVIFEDLALKGYTTIGYRHPNLEEMKFTLLKLAKLHAISYKLCKEEKDNIITTLNKGSMNSTDPNTFPFVKYSIGFLKEILSERDDLKQYVPHIASVEHLLCKRSIDMFNEAGSGKRDGIFVLNHGDFHLKNIMIQKNEDKLTDVKLLDYQISIFGSPAIDLHYAFTMMFSPEMRRDHYDELLYFYITNFQDTLRKTEYKGHIPTHIEIRQELAKHRYWGKLSGMYAMFFLNLCNLCWWL